MKTISIRRRSIRITAAIERALYTLRNAGYVAKKSEFVEGALYRYQTYVLAALEPSEMKALGIHVRRRVIGRSPTRGEIHEGSRREQRFFQANPLCDYVISGNARRVNLIIRKLEEDR